MEDNVITKQDLLEIKADIVEEIMTILKCNLKDRYLAKKDTCKYLGISNNTLDIWISKGLPVLKINGIMRFDRIAIDKWIGERV